MFLAWLKLHTHKIIIWKAGLNIIVRLDSLLINSPPPLFDSLFSKYNMQKNIEGVITYWEIRHGSWTRLFEAVIWSLTSSYKLQSFLGCNFKQSFQSSWFSARHKQNALRPKKKILYLECLLSKWFSRSGLSYSQQQGQAGGSVRLATQNAVASICHRWYDGGIDRGKEWGGGGSTSMVIAVTPSYTQTQTH